MAGENNVSSEDVHGNISWSSLYENIHSSQIAENKLYGTKESSGVKTLVFHVAVPSSVSNTTYGPWGTVMCGKN